VVTAAFVLHYDPSVVALLGGELLVLLARRDPAPFLRELRGEWLPAYGGIAAVALAFAWASGPEGRRRRRLAIGLDAIAFGVALLLQGVRLRPLRNRINRLAWS
jgi:hypothetical protein